MSRLIEFLEQREFVGPPQRIKNYDRSKAEAAVDNCIADLDAMDEPEVHDIEWVPELSPRHDVKRFLMVVVPLFIAIFALLYAGAEIMDLLGKVWEWAGLPS